VLGRGPVTFPASFVTNPLGSPLGAQRLQLGLWDWGPQAAPNFNHRINPCSMTLAAPGPGSQPCPMGEKGPGGAGGLLGWCWLGCATAAQVGFQPDPGSRPPFWGETGPFWCPTPVSLPSHPGCAVLGCCCPSAQAKLLVPGGHRVCRAAVPGVSLGWAMLSGAGCPTSLTAQRRRDSPACTCPEMLHGLHCSSGRQLPVSGLGPARFGVRLVCWLVGAPICFRSSSWMAPVQFWLQLICGFCLFLYQFVSALVSGPAWLRLSSCMALAHFSFSLPVVPVGFRSSSWRAPARLYLQVICFCLHSFQVQLIDGSSLFLLPARFRLPLAPVSAHFPLQLVSAPAPVQFCCS